MFSENKPASLLNKQTKKGEGVDWVNKTRTTEIETLISLILLATILINNKPLEAAESQVVKDFPELRATGHLRPICHREKFKRRFRVMTRVSR